MDDNKQRVVYVRYAIDVQSLFSSETPASVDEAASIAKYERLCEEELQRSYPNAAIDLMRVEGEGVTPDVASTYVLALIEEEEREKAEEVENVDEICRRIYERFSIWNVFKPSVRLSEISTYSNIHPAIIRSYLARGLLKGAERRDGYWYVPLQQIEEINPEYERRESAPGFSDSFRRIENLVVGIWEEIGDAKVDTLQSVDRLLLTTNNGFDSDILTSDFVCIEVAVQASKLLLQLDHFVDIKSWSISRWSYEMYAQCLDKNAKKLGVKTVLDIDPASSRTCGISFFFRKNSQTISSLLEAVEDCLRKVREVVNTSEIELAGGPNFDESYSVSGQEDRFCREILDPLLKRMGYESVRYVHGTGEFGKDFIFFRRSRFGEPIYLALQAKAGNVSGGANSLIDTILAQIGDAFSMPYTKEPEKSKSEIYIALMIIAISGKFTDNAIEKIHRKLLQTPHLVGSVFFWDQQKIRNLIHQHYRRDES